MGYARIMGTDKLSVVRYARIMGELLAFAARARHRKGFIIIIIKTESVKNQSR